MEKTPKPLKALQLAGFLLLVLGVIVRAGAGEVYGTAVALLGFLLWSAGKALAWWRNG